jgi:prophage tail gpP-like protein
MIQVQLSNKVYTGFVDIEVIRDIETLASTFRFSASTLEGGSFPISRGESCNIIVDGETVLTGYVDKISVRYMKNTHTIEVSGRDRTSDIIDSTIDGTVELSTPISLENIISKTLGSIGYTGFKIINNAGSIDDFQKTQMVSGTIGETAFDFLDSYCANRQVLLTTDGLGNIVLTRGAGIASPANLQNLLNGTENNIFESSVDYDDEKRFNKYIIKAQGNTAAIASTGSTVAPKDLVSIKGESTDSDVRTSRLCVLNATKVSNISDAVNRAQWERDIRRARAIQYNPSVNGHSITGTKTVWKPLLLVNVNDVFCNVKDTLIVRKVTYRSELGDVGNVTKLDLVPRDTFKLLSDQAKKKEKKRKGKKKGGYATQQEINAVLLAG